MLKYMIRFNTLNRNFYCPWVNADSGMVSWTIIMSILKLFYFIIIHSQWNFEAECNHSLVRKSLKQVHNVRDPPYQTLICLFNIQYMKFEFIIIIWSFMFFSFTKARRSKMLTKPTLSLNQPLRCIPSIC